jgi:hypothetical protein
MRMGLRQWLTGRPSPESLAVELVERGRSTRTYDGGDSYYFRPKGDWDRIGEDQWAKGMGQVWRS